MPISNANARATLSNTAIGNYNHAIASDPVGVPIKVITYSGRDSDTMPPVWVAKQPRSRRGHRRLHPLRGHGYRGGGQGCEPAAVGQLAVHSLPPGRLHGGAVPVLQLEEVLRRRDGPCIAGLNYFLLDCERGGDLNKLLGEKRDVKAWLTWLERYAHGEVGAIETPIGSIPRFEDLQKIFKEMVGKEYTRPLYEKQFSFYVDNILARIQLQEDAYRKEKKIPPRIFEVYEEQRKGLQALKEKHGTVVLPAMMDGAAAR